MIYLLPAAAGVAVSVLLLLYYRRENEKYRAYRRAASRLLSIHALRRSLRREESLRSSVRTMLILGWEDDGWQEYIFDLAEGVWIGRGKEGNQLVIYDLNVSRNHCRLTEQNDCLYLEDLESANGTLVKKNGRWKRVWGKEQIREGCEFSVGPVIFKVKTISVDSGAL